MQRQTRSNTPRFRFPNKRKRTPTLLQMEAAECGAAALGIILGYYGRIVPLTELRQACGVSRDGSKASNILIAARQYGLQAKGFRLDLDALQTTACPYIVFWNFNHYLVVEGFAKDRVYLNDPATGSRVASWAEFNEAYTGITLIFEPTAEFRPGGQKNRPILALLSRLKGSEVALGYSMLTGLLLVLPGLATAGFSQIFIDDILIKGKSDWLRPLILAIIIVALLSGLLTQLQLRLLRQMHIKLSLGMSSRFLWHILRLPLSFHDQRFAGNISSRVELNDTLANLLSGKLASSAISALTIVFYAIVMLQYDRILTLIGLSFVLLNLVVLQWVSRSRTDSNIRLMQERGKVSGIAVAGLQSMETIKASGQESDFFARWSGAYAKTLNAQQELDRASQWLNVLPSSLSAIATMLLLVVGGLRVMNGDISIGMLVALQGLMGQLLEPTNTLVSLGSELQELEGNLNRLDDVLHHPADPHLTVIRAHASEPILPKLNGRLELRNLTFGYSRVAPPLIENLNLIVQPGQRVALVGGSGSGKSTVAKLICGLYEPWEGEILLDDQPRTEIPRRVLTNSLSLIEQDPVLFAGSVRDNLTLWDTTVSDRAIQQACQDAAIHEVIQSLPGGYAADLLEGAVNLSGGQRQRLEIARALVNQPSILVLDEATSALDAETEQVIDRNLRLRGCTCIIVAHRLSTIRDCNEIIVLEWGKVVQRGTHEQLRQVEGTYLQLIRSSGEAIVEGTPC